MFWVIRGTDGRTDSDFALVVEAGTRAAAEAFALKRAVPYEVIHEATDADIEEARRSKRLWKQTSERRQYTCFGQPLASSQVVCIMVTGVATILLLLVRTGSVQLFT